MADLNVTSGGNAEMIKGFQEIGTERAVQKAEQMVPQKDDRLDDNITGAPKKTEAGSKADRDKHLAGLKKKEDTEEGKKAQRPVNQIARDFAKKYPRHNEMTLVAVRRLVKQAKSTADIKKFLSGIYKDNPLMHLEVLTFIEESFDETTDMSDEVKELVRQTKQEMQDGLVAEGGEAAFPSEPSSDVMKSETFKGLYQEVANQTEVNAHEIYNKLAATTKGDLSNIRQVAASLLKQLSQDIRSAPAQEIDRALMQTRIGEMRAVIALTQVPEVFKKWDKLVNKQYGGL